MSDKRYYSRVTGADAWFRNNPDPSRVHNSRPKKPSRRFKVTRLVGRWWIEIDTGKETGFTDTKWYRLPYDVVSLWLLMRKGR